MIDTTVVGVRISIQRFEDAISTLLDAAHDRRAIRAHFATVHSVVEATRNARLREVFATASMVCSDGVPLVWVTRLRGLRGQRVCGPDTLLALADRGRPGGLRHFFLGGAPGTPEALAANLSRRFPGLAVAGTESPPFRPLSEAEDAALVERVNASRADVVWIGLGSPKQDFWAAEHAAKLAAPLVLPVGAAFDFYAGRVRRAPGWMQRLGLEWLFRLAMEPRRLLRRYLLTNSRFIYLVLREELGRRRRQAPTDRV